MRVADDHDAAAIAQQLRGEVDRIGRASRSRDDHRVTIRRRGRDAQTVERSTVVGDVDRPQPPRLLDERIDKVDPDDVAAGRPEDLPGELPDQPQPDDRHPFAKAHVRLAYAVHGDAGHGRERSRLERHLVRQPDAQVPGD